MKKTAIVILNYNNFEDTVNCIGSILKYNTAPCKFIIIDNGSSNKSVVIELDRFLSQTFSSCYIKINAGDKIDEALPYCSFVVSEKNLGYACGNNLGLKYSYNDPEIENVMILNNDVLFVEDIIPGLIETRDRLPQCAIISPILYKKDFEDYDYNVARLAPKNTQLIIENFFLAVNYFGYTRKIRRKNRLLENHLELLEGDYIEVELPSGSCMLLNKDLAKKIGMFNPNTFLYFEENILHRQISELQLKNYVIPSLKCIHLGACSTKKSASTFIARVGMRSKHYFLIDYCKISGISKTLFLIGEMLFYLKTAIVKLMKE